MPFGIPSKDFRGGFGLPHKKDFEPIKTKSPEENNENKREAILHYVAENFIAPLDKLKKIWYNNKKKKEVL